MSRSLRRALLRPGAVLMLLAGFLGGCHGKSAPEGPSVQILRAPPASIGGPEQMDHIEGRVKGAAQGQQIVIYAKNGIWWIQPFKSRPFTAIQGDQTWSSSTHLGTKYAALLVDAGYRPRSRVDSLPEVGGGVAAIATVDGRAAAPAVSKVIHFSGYDWTVRAAGSERGGEMNEYDPANSWVDNRGYLHLRMGMHDGHWSCAEVNLTRSLGYGTYKFVVKDSANLDPSAVFGMFTLDEDRADDVRIELDFELSRWGRSEYKNAQYVVQPYYIPQNISRFQVPAGELTHVLRWESGSASFKTYRGTAIGPSTKSLYEHVFTSGIPTAAAETVHLDLYDYYHSRSAKHVPAEVVIEKFEYLP